MSIAQFVNGNLPAPPKVTFQVPRKRPIFSQTGKVFLLVLAYILGIISGSFSTLWQPAMLAAAPAGNAKLHINAATIHSPKLAVADVNVPCTNTTETIKADLPNSQALEGALDERLLPLLNYTPTMHPLALRRGVMSLGDSAPMRRFVKKLTSGEAVKVVATGGSVTIGHGATDGWPYFRRFQRYIDATFPNDKHSYRNLAYGGATSPMFSLCVNTLFDEADLVIVEFSANDRFADTYLNKFRVEPDNPNSIPSVKSFERLLRKLLNMPSRPAVVIMHYFNWSLSKPQGVSPPMKDIIPHGPAEWGESNGTGTRSVYYDSAENEYTVIASYYGLPQLSVRHTAYQLMISGVPGYQAHVYLKDHENITKAEDLFYFDYAHPQSSTGHNFMAELLIELLHQTAVGLRDRPYGSLQEEETRNQPLPLPMIVRNYERMGKTCMIGESMANAVTKQSGHWKFVDERPPGAAFPKWGWTANDTGAWVIFALDSRTNDNRQLNAEAMLGFLRSYEKMGRFKAECVSGCVCNATEADGHDTARKVSVSVSITIPVTQHENCQIKATILQETSSGSHKVRFTGLILGHGQSMDTDVKIGNTMDNILSG